MNDLIPGTDASFWANQNQQLRDYYLNEWCVPKYDDREIFELLVLETFSSGLNWMMMLNKRANFAAAFYDYDIDAIAGMTAADVERLMGDTSIVRNRTKILAVIADARAVQGLRASGQTLAPYIWAFTEGEIVANLPSSQYAVPTQTSLSKRVAQEMKKRGFKFLGPTIAYSFLQAIGMVDDHITERSGEVC